MAYAHLYKSYGKTVDEIKEDDVTITMIREVKPVKLFQYFEEHSYPVTNPYRWIYYIGNVTFPTQIIVTRELDGKHHKRPRVLSGRLERDNIWELLDSRKRLTEKTDRELADSILEVSIGANRQLIEELGGDDSMYEVLMEIMEPQIKLRENESRKEGIKEGIKGTIIALRNLGQKNSEIKTAIMEIYALSEDEAAEYL